ncbi:hypothetical protein ACOSQ4_021749 [Xanthoceras sorbifolium]
MAPGWFSCVGPFLGDLVGGGGGGGGFKGWQAPCVGAFKINVDAACNRSGGRSGTGIVIRNAQGTVVDAAALVFQGFSSVEVAEARAILGGLSLAVDNGWYPIFIESDSLNVVRLCKGDSFSLSEIDNVIHDIRSLLIQAGDVSIAFVPRSCNVVAHSVARWALCSDCSVFWNAVIPSWLVSLASVDVSSF